jgi:hypothetical protein
MRLPALLALLGVLLLAACDTSVVRHPLGTTPDAGTPPAPKILTQSIPNALLGEQYGVALESSGGAPPLRWKILSATAGVTWLSLTPDAGVLEGTAPRAPDAGSLTLQLTDALARSDQATLSLAVLECNAGDSRPCAVSSGVVCLLGAQTCANGVLTGCNAGTQSTSADQCGATCESCSLQGGDTCVGGRCVCGPSDAGCDASESCCGGACADLSADLHNCKLCGNDCLDPSRLPPNADAGCGAEDCAYACDAPLTDCDGDLNRGSAGNGCETNLSTGVVVGATVLKCGSCTNNCTAPNTDWSCNNGTCQISSCQGTFRDCTGGTSDGCETNIANNDNNCGACGHVCRNDIPANTNVADAGCAGTTCKVTSCEGTFADCDGSLANGCEVDTDSNANNCGFCGHVCPSTAPSCQNGGCCKITCSGSPPVCSCN